MSTFAEIFGPQGFDCNSVDPAEDFLIPGDYICKITESEVSATKAGTGHYLKVVLEVVQDCKDKGRKLYDYINIQNPNPIAERLAAKSLSALGRATGIWSIQNPQQLLNKIVIATVTKNDSGNNIRTYKSVSEMQSATTAVVVPPALLRPQAPVYTVPETVAPPASPAPVYQQPQQPEVRLLGTPLAQAPPVQAPAPAVPPPALAATNGAPTAVAGVPVWQQPQPPG